jgi:deoxyhypusine synthase
VRGYLFDVQIITAPVTDGSLSSCPPAEAVTWGKVDKDAYKQTTESLQADYTTVMPLLVAALLERRRKFAELRETLGEERCSPSSRRRAATCATRAGTGSMSIARVCSRNSSPRSRKNGPWLLDSLKYPLPLKP